MLFVFISIALGLISACLWWQLARTHALNAQLRAELTKLRGRLRDLRE